jgi:hypothetical protein
VDKSVKALYNNAMLPCMEELVIKENLHLCMEKFSATMGEKWFFWTFPSGKLGGKMREFIWELPQWISMHNQWPKLAVHLLFGNKQCGCTGCKKVCIVDILIHCQ